jgi:hypothetical protein
MTVLFAMASPDWTTEGDCNLINILANCTTTQYE